METNQDDNKFFVVAREKIFKGFWEYLCFGFPPGGKMTTWWGDKDKALEEPLALDEALFYARKKSRGFADKCVSGREYCVLRFDMESPGRNSFWEVAKFIDGETDTIYPNIMAQMSEIANQIDKK